MLYLILSAVLIQPTAPGQATVSGLPTGADVYAHSPDCTVKLVGTRVLGVPGCTFRLAVISEDGGVKRYWGRLGDDQDTEDAPIAKSEQDTEDDPTEPIGRPARRQENSPQTSRTQFVASDGARSYPLTFAGHLSLGRGIGEFAVVDFGLKASAVYDQSVRLGLGWHRGQARTKAPGLETQKRVEQTLDMFLVRIGYLHPLRPHLTAYADAGFGTGRFTTDAVADDRNEVSASTQAFLVFRPSLGFEWRSKKLAIGLGWQLTYAEGQWFDFNEFGDGNESGPPDNEGMIDHGLEVSVGVYF